MPTMKIAICISGGGLDGLDVGAGIALALRDRGWLAGGPGRQLHFLGTSAGAGIAAWLAAGWRANDLGNLLRSLRDSAVRDRRLLAIARSAWIDYIWEGRKLGDLLERTMPSCGNVLATENKLSVFATRVKSLGAVNVGDPSGGDPIWRCVLASMSIPLVLPPVRLSDGCAYQDGGLAANLPLPADLASYDRVVACVLAGPRPAYKPPSSVLSGALSLWSRILAEQTAAAEERVRKHPGGIVLRPPLEGRGGMLHFDHGLIDRAFEWSLDHLPLAP
jgi:predicted acylesterase/phospholipase RssA